MLSWNAPSTPPLALTLAADARLGKTDYIDDQVWELRGGGGEPAALAFETTYGLRANRMRLFPRFLKPGLDRTDPAGFFAPVKVLSYYPNYLSIVFNPFEGLEVVAEYWIPESQAAAGRFKITNYSVLPQIFRLELAALLNARGHEGSLHPHQTAQGYILTGETGNLQPVIALSGGARVTGGPFPALGLDLEMYPGNVRQYTWATAGARTLPLSLETVTRTLALPWDANITRVEMQNLADMVRINSGNPDWDEALAVSQKLAHQMFLHNWPYLPAPSFVLTRRPDQGFSARGDGSDHPSTWKGQTAFDAYYLANLLLPAAPQRIEGLVRNFLAFQQEDGRIDWRVGLGGQRTQRLAQPMLAALAVQVGPYLDEKSWYGEVYPPLKRFFDCWMAPEQDSDGDGFPEWENALQSALEDSPIFERFSPEGRGVDTTILESPALAAMLYRECQSLEVMARTLGLQADLPALAAARARLQAVLAETWDGAAGIYHYRDGQSHTSLPSASVVSFQGSGVFATRRRFKLPRRLIVHLETHEERTYAVVFTIYGYTEAGETTETLAPRSFSWLGRRGYAATQNAFLAVERIEVQGLMGRDKAKIFTPDFSVEDCSLFLPLWAGAPEPEVARQMVETTLLKRFWHPHGIPTAPGHVDTISIPWNLLIGEGLLRYGYRAQAAELCARLLNTTANAFKRHQAFYQHYHARSGQPGGERGHLYGLAPLGLFLHTLGIRQLHPKQILIDGFNPFPKPVTVQYRRVLLNCCADHTEIVFPTGQHVVIDRPGLHRVIVE